MPNIDPLQSSLYFSATAAAQTAAGANAGTANRKTVSAKKSRFSNMIEQQESELALAEAGFPPEIAEMDFEEAFVYLKDRADVAADRVKAELSTDSFTEYRQAVSHFMKFIVRSNYDIEIHKRRRPNRKFNTNKFYLIQVIDQKLDTLAAEILLNHSETLRILAGIDEINGILVDLIT